MKALMIAALVSAVFMSAAPVRAAEGVDNAAGGLTAVNTAGQSSPAAQAGQPRRLRLAELLEEAEGANPSLAAMKSRYLAARERIAPAGALEDPMFGIGAVNVPVESFSFREEEMTGKMVEFSQMLPFPGKRALKREIAREESNALEGEYLEDALMLREKVKMAFFELYSIGKRLEVIERSTGLLGSLQKIAEARYSVGTGMLKEVIKAQLERSMLLDKKLMLEKEARTKRAYLGSLLGRGVPVEGAAEDIAPTKVDMDVETLKGLAGSKPRIASADARIRKAEAMAKMARKEYLPDFTLSANYMQRDTLKGGMEQSDMFSAVVSVNLPVWRKSKLDPAVREAALERDMAVSEKESAKTELYYKVESLMGEIGQTDRLMKLYRDVIIPQANEDINAGLAGYEVGKTEYMSLLDSIRGLFDYQAGYYNALAEREKAVAELETTVGMEFTTGVDGREK